MAQPNSIQRANIQGNILAGFNKDFQCFLFFAIDDAAMGRAFLGRLIPEVASTEEVAGFNALFRRTVRRRRQELGTLKAVWMNLAFTNAGLAALGVPQDELKQFGAAFFDGMRKRVDQIGDVGASAPEHWIPPFDGSDDVHGLLIVAADDQADLQQHVARYVTLLTATKGVRLVLKQDGAVRQDQPGHEHFGFKDGVSQPGIRGFTVPDDPQNNPDQGHPGQDLLHPGEFVLGYPTQIRKKKEGVDGPNPDPGPISDLGPDWARDGSFLVWRRLRQDVRGFHQALGAHAQALGIDAGLLGAKMVGRYASGCPLERTENQAAKDPTFDPTLADPSVADPSTLTDAQINNFEFEDDADGRIVPRAAHIRKAYPRDQEPPGESETQAHRLLRRGIPFGTSFRPSLGATRHSAAALHDPAADDRGLLFLAYQSDIERQFEFVQQQWVNKRDFPRPDDGEDPIIAQSDAGTFGLPAGPHGGNDARLTLGHFVQTTGGDYFFAPSLSALERLAGGAGGAG